jgi:hypothetical protein
MICEMDNVCFDALHTACWAHFTSSRRLHARATDTRCHVEIEQCESTDAISMHIRYDAERIASFPGRVLAADDLIERRAELSAS